MNPSSGVKRFVPYLALALLIAAAAAGIGYGNRRIRGDDPTVGFMTTRYCWWKICEVDMDRNRDGRIDGKEIFDPPVRDWKALAAIPARVSFVDQDFDGEFEVRIETEPSGAIASVRIDTSGDGKYDRILTGQEAEAYMGSVVRPRSKEIYEKLTKPGAGR